jgi:iron complex transport system substrate-binding protein
MRVTTLFPSATEIVFAVGAGDEVVGVSHACDYPLAAKERKAVTKERFDPAELSSAEIFRRKVETTRQFGSLYRLDETAMWGCQADVVVTQGPAEYQLVSIHAVRAIAEGLNPRPEVVTLYPRHLDDVIDDHVRAGFAVRHMGEARQLADSMRERIAAVETALHGMKRRRVAFIQWLDPIICGGFWVPQLIEIARGIDTLNTAGLTPASFNWPELRKQDPDTLIIACDGLSIERVRSEIQLLTDRPGWWELPARRLGRVFIGDGGCFTRAGPRLIDGLEAIAWALHPDLMPAPPSHVLQKYGD